MNDSALRGQTAVVLGGTSGLGRALSFGLGLAGANVVACSRQQAAVRQTADELEASGIRTLRCCADVTDRNSLERLHAVVYKEFPKVDILVNAAGVTHRAPTVDYPEDRWDEIMDTNLTGTLRACQIFGKTMLDQGYGRIVNIASLSSFVAFHEVAAYCASKAAVASLTRSLAVEWAPFGVTVNAIAPGIFPTDLNRELLHTGRGQELLSRTPMARFGDAKELVSAALFLADPTSTFVTGQIITVDGGFMASGVNQ